MIPELETERLLLRPVSLDDAPQIQRIFPDWRIMEFLTTPWPYPEDGAETYLRDKVLPEMRDGDGWFWSLRLKTAPDELVGMINLKTGDDNHRGFWIAPHLWGQGLMTEACEVVTDFWFEVLYQPVMRVPKAVDNIASRRISERAGMRLIWQGDKDFASGRRPAEIWEITREEWRTRKR